MENIRKLLDIKLLAQPFGSPQANLQLDEGKLIAQLYSRLENCISVLSDMKARKSYIYYSPIAEQLHLDTKETEIHSIWEDKLLSQVNKEDLQKKYRLEFQFFQLLNSVDITERADYGVVTKLRVKNTAGTDLVLQHRLLYIGSSADGSVWLALCLYNLMFDHPGFNIPEGVIINTLTGTIIDPNQHGVKEILTSREKAVLQLIKQGKRSKEIAGNLSLSIHTVNRHRQNIFQKLNVTNAMEACRVAEATGLI
ncbi:response regulator transcription factor [Mucilaginibacter sp. UR6-11]|uniref:response regulator transcription factor n=1 Tax=Mucilaginibacter sp. UR6-11 TaxID=1435644 RepID=UPI001E51F18E|nr:helix-turn-helix transcriptional regulator [Mucilaginibacter sp. UR6-11]MCC8425001.1 helix-turn-helix transcriptional regulator [Mucilaginibacter sp. UR6-11]